jgi:hypothetical protein
VDAEIDGMGAENTAPVTRTYMIDFWVQFGMLRNLFEFLNESFAVSAGAFDTVVFDTIQRDRE